MPPFLELSAALCIQCMNMKLPASVPRRVPAMSASHQRTFHSVLDQLEEMDCPAYQVHSVMFYLFPQLFEPTNDSEEADTMSIASARSMSSITHARSYEAANAASPDYESSPDYGAFQDYPNYPDYSDDSDNSDCSSECGEHSWQIDDSVFPESTSDHEDPQESVSKSTQVTLTKGTASDV